MFDLTGMWPFYAAFALWNSQQRARTALQELRSLNPEVAEELARDLNLSVNDFEGLVQNIAGSDRLMDAMMAAFSLDRAKLGQAGPATMRYAQLTCARCSAKKRCSRELVAGTARANADIFCPNADLFAFFAPHHFADAGADI